MSDNPHIAQLESGNLIVLQDRNFPLLANEEAFLRPDFVDGGGKSIKFSPAQQRLWGNSHEQHTPALTSLLSRYSDFAKNLIQEFAPEYMPSLVVGNASFRPVGVENRVQSKRHDDRLLHVDAFPSRPMQGNRIFRVFTNINPHGEPRVWKTGEPFAKVAAHFLPRIRGPFPGTAQLMQWVGLTKQKRSAYDHYMLNIHDRMKLDDDYQASAPNVTHNIPAGASWIVFSDQVSHAALAGQFLLEQTFLLPVEGMQHPATSPLRVLESLTGRKLV